MTKSKLTGLGHIDRHYVTLCLTDIRLDLNNYGATRGEWSDTEFQKEIIKRLQSSGVLEMLNPRKITLDVQDNETGSLASRTSWSVDSAVDLQIEREHARRETLAAAKRNNCQPSKGAAIKLAAKRPAWAQSN
jgi:hypothetical protein